MCRPLLQGELGMMLITKCSTPRLPLRVIRRRNATPKQDVVQRTLHSFQSKRVPTCCSALFCPAVHDSSNIIG